MGEAGTAHRSGDAVGLPLPAPTFRIVPTFGALLASLAGQRAVIGLDIPIGLPSGQPHDSGVRLADRAARAFLGGHRGSSVFSAPCRPTLFTQDYSAACDAELAARGKKLSKQAFGIIPKIREVDQAMTPAQQLPPDDVFGTVVREVHPEVAFAVLRGGGVAGFGLVSSKRDRLGEAERLALLRPFLPVPDVPGVRADLRRQHRESHSGPTSKRIVGSDDIVDALVCLVAAYRIATGQSRTFPSGAPERDARGLRMEIVG
jgi:predicted RNase H-like nuclease